MNFSTFDATLQPLVSAGGEVRSLSDNRFDWAARKWETIQLARLYEMAGDPDRALRAASCSTFLEYDVTADGERHLSGGNFCQLRLCPLCISRRSKKMAYKLSQVLNLVEANYDVRFIFLTLTIRNVEGPELGEALTDLTQGWHRLLMHRAIRRAVVGSFRAIEITRGDNRWHEDKRTGRRRFYEDKGYHPHIHAILAVPSSYFGGTGLYLSKDEWIEHWRVALGVSYDPSIDIEVTKARGERPGSQASALEAAKYAVKSSTYIDRTQPLERQVGIVRDYTAALHGRRLTSFTGILKTAARTLKAERMEDDQDLVHVDEESIREDVATLHRVYRWSFGAGDYLLTSESPIIHE